MMISKEERAMLVMNNLTVDHTEIKSKEQIEKNLRVRLAEYEKSDRSKGFSFSEEEFDVFNEMLLNGTYQFQAKNEHTF
jgi:hypothetical protein